MGDADHANRSVRWRTARRGSISRPSRRATAIGSSTIDGDVATLVMDVDEKGALFEGYDLKLNSYDLGVDIELADAHRAAALRASASARRGAALGQAAGVLRRRQYPHAGRRKPRA